MPIVPNLHQEPYSSRTDAGSLREYIELHTYEESTDHAYATIHGGNSDSIGATVELFLNEEDVRSIRNALNNILGESDPIEEVRAILKKRQNQSYVGQYGLWRDIDAVVNREAVIVETEEGL